MSESRKKIILRPILQYCIVLKVWLKACSTEHWIVWCRHSDLSTDGQKTHKLIHSQSTQTMQCTFKVIAQRKFEFSPSKSLLQFSDENSCCTLCTVQCAFMCIMYRVHRNSPKCLNDWSFYFCAIFVIVSQLLLLRGRGAMQTSDACACSAIEDNSSAQFSVHRQLNTVVYAICPFTLMKHF